MNMAVKVSSRRIALALVIVLAMIGLYLVGASGILVRMLPVPFCYAWALPRAPLDEYASAFCDSDVLFSLSRDEVLHGMPQRDGSSELDQWPFVPDSPGPGSLVATGAKFTLAIVMVVELALLAVWCILDRRWRGRPSHAQSDTFGGANDGG
jgi:hypothetical protein